MKENLKSKIDSAFGDTEGKQKNETLPRYVSFFDSTAHFAEPISKPRKEYSMFYL